MTAPTTPDATPVYALTSADRCDRCNAQAMVRCMLLSGALDFCSHHYNANELFLLGCSVTIEDTREHTNKNIKAEKPALDIRPIPE